MKNLFDIGDRVIVVTGATGVLAGGTAKYLQQQGAYVAYLGRSQERVNDTLAAAEQISSRCCGMVCDVLDQRQLDTVFSRLLQESGRIDVLINGAGGNLPGANVEPDQDLLALKMEDYSAVVDLNLRGTVMPTLTFCRAFAEQGSGCVVNFSSMAAGRALTRVLGYSNAKAGIDSFTRWMATELALRYGDGIRVNAVAPGFFLGRQNRRILVKNDGSYTERGTKVIEGTPFRRFGKPDEIYGTVHFLISDAASFVTGAVIPVDGGFSAYSGV
jgi:NAD(P)-dependent dehydrogenase (short-subunit alcohol dehydrogenase family)